MARRKKKFIEGEIEKVKFPNISEFTFEGKKVNFKGGIEGQKVNVLISRKRNDSMEGKLFEIIEKSKLEKNKPCPNYLECGGCSYQTVSHDYELDLKYRQIKELFSDIYTDDIEIFQSPKIKAYRNKMEYTFADMYKDSPIMLGLHKKNRFYEVVDTKECNLVHEDFEIIRNAVIKYARENNLSYLKKKNHEGLLRHLIIRYALTTGEIMVNIVTTTQESLEKNSFIQMLLSLKLEGKIKSIVHTENNSLADAVVAEKVEIIYGQGYISEKIFGLEFKVTPFSFFQPNVYGAINLYEKAIEMCKDIENKIVFDLYSGTGTIGQIIARKAKEVYGIEIVKEAVESANKSAKENGISNCNFIAGDVLTEIENRKEIVDIIVVDPPREGINQTALEKITSCNAEKIVYISCNPKTQKRDAELFIKNGYELKELKIFNQFPRTTHVETIVLLSKLDSKRHIAVELSIDEMDLTSAESKTTYKQIQNYVLEKFGFKISTLYIAQVKRKYGLEIRRHYNISSNKNQKIPQCPIEKEEAIVDALKYYKMI